MAVSGEGDDRDREERAHKSNTPARARTRCDDAADTRQDDAFVQPKRRSPSATRKRSHLRQLVIPPKPTSLTELVRVIHSISYVKRKRTIRQEWRQFEVFMLHVRSRMSHENIARSLRISRETVINDIDHEEQRLAAERSGSYKNVSERRVSVADLACLFRAWGVAHDLTGWIAELRGQEKGDTYPTGPLTRAKALYERS
jgi:hypothetical protein